MPIFGSTIVPYFYPMNDLFPDKTQLQAVANFQELVSTPFQGQINAMYWNRQLEGDFAEIVHKVECLENMVVVTPAALRALELTPQGNRAREVILNDLALLEAYGAQPVLNVIKNYERDQDYPFFPTDVYSFHVDRSPVPTATFLCTYFGASSELVPNAAAVQKVLIPEIRATLLQLYDGKDDQGFEDFLQEYFFDLHYAVPKEVVPTRLGIGHLWKLAVDHPDSPVLPCVHRAPLEQEGEPRLLLIC